MFSSKANYTKLRTNLRLVINRLKLLEKKKTELALKARREIADYIAASKEDRARIRVEHIIREDYLVEAMEIVEMLCDLLLARFGLIEKMAELDPGIEEAVATVIWVTPRLSGDIPELVEITKQLSLKYSKEYADMCRRNGFGKVNEKVMHKMNLAAPPKILVENYMIEIAKCYKVPFEPDNAIMMGEPPEVNNLIDFANIDTMPTGQSTANTAQMSQGPAMGMGNAAAGMGNFAAGNTDNSTYDNWQNMSAADRKHHEAMGYDNNKRPPSPPNYNGGGGGGMAMPAAGLSTPVNGTQGYSPGQSFPNQNPVNSCPQGGMMPPPLPTKPPNSNQNSPEGATQNQNPAGPGRGPMEHSWSMLDDENGENMPSLPPYEEVVNSPNTYPSPPHGPQPFSNTMGGPQMYNNPMGGQPGGGPMVQPNQGPVPAPRYSPSPQPRQLGPTDLPDVPGLPSVPTNSVGGGQGDEVNFDDLTRRFEELKRRK